MKLRFTRDSTASAPLLYWLLIVCGLAGITMMRWDSLWEIAPIWLGTLAGVGIGQALAWQRIRGWIPAVITICGLWFAPVLYYLLFDAFGTDAEVGCLAFLPAAVCGYLSLASERGALVAFWYPAVLWMLVILDGPAAASFDFRSAMPLAVGLATLFVAFLRARETRRAVLWRTYGSDRLAKPITQAVLKSSPVRSASQLAFTALIGTGALVLASWIGPHLWKLEKEKHAREVAAATAAQLGDASTSSSSSSDEQPCCWEQSLSEEKTVRVKEYLPLLRGHAEHHPIASPMPCKTCGSRTASYASNGSGLNGKSSSSSSSSFGTSSHGVGAGGGNGGGAWTHVGNPSTATPTPTYVPPTVNDPRVTHDDPAIPPPTPIAPATTAKPTDTAPLTTSRPMVARPPVSKPVVVMRKTRSAPPKDYGAPWEWTLSLCIVGLSLHLLLRAFRRTLTLRHLAHPFWPETLDQRISNHWERMLIGLRDAGIHPAREEQPQAFARRVAIEGMTTCATILERVRHGVRVDDGDLDSMDAAATNVYREARARAGLMGRLTAWMRWPLV
jgi:hypothetical protein